MSKNKRKRRTTKPSAAKSYSHSGQQTGMVAASARPRAAQHNSGSKKSPAPTIKSPVTVMSSTPRSQQRRSSRSAASIASREVGFFAWLKSADVLPEMRGTRWSRLIPGAVVTIAAFILYFLTAARSIVSGDSSDFLVTSQVAGVAHAPGYPLLTMLGNLFSHLPLGSSVIFRINLLAAVCSAATIAVVYAIGLRITSRAIPAALAALALATTPLFWKTSLQIETFPLNNLIAACLMYCLVRWHENPKRPGFILGAVFLLGLGMTNQQTIILLSPAIIIAAIMHRKYLNGRLFGLAVLAFIVGLLPYIYVPIASGGNPIANWDDVHSFSSFMQLVTRSDYGSLTLTASGSGSGGFVGYFARLFYLGRAAGLLIGLLGLFGGWLAHRRAQRRVFLALTVVPFFFTTVIFLMMTPLDPRQDVTLFTLERFYLLPIVLMAPLAAIAISTIIDWVAPKLKATKKQSAIVISTAALAVISLVVGVSYAQADVSKDTVATTYAQDVLSGLQQNTILFVNGDAAAMPLLYASSLANDRPDVTVVQGGLLKAPWYQAQLRRNTSLSLPQSTFTLLDILQLNSTRPAATIGGLPDDSVKDKYYSYADGLVNDLVPTSTDISLPEVQALNTQKMAMYHAPDPKSIKSVSFESILLDYYASPAVYLGDQCAQLKQSCATTYYNQALTISPHGPAAADVQKKLSALKNG